jgi:hypothetical protein
MLKLDRIIVVGLLAGVVIAGVGYCELPVFTDVTDSAGIDFKQSYGDYDLSNIVEGTGSGAMFFDYDGDGWQDIYLLNGTWTGRLRIRQSRRVWATRDSVTDLRLRISMRTAMSIFMF